MKRILFVICLSAFHMSTSTAIAADKVVVIPLGGAEHYMYWQGAWAAGTTYKIGDGVQYEGSSYVCVEAHGPASDSPPSVYWNLLASKGDSGATAAGQSCSEDRYVSGFDNQGNIICQSSWKYVFLTNEPHTGSLGGVAGADAICQADADAALLPGQYKAWLSTNQNSPEQDFSRPSVKYILPSGRLVDFSWYDLIDGNIITSINPAIPGAT